jgi:hypothetical protein
MLLEIENQLHRRVHSTLGQSAVVLRLAEELDSSGRVAEQAMIIVSFTSSRTTNPFEGAGIPTVRTRSLSYTLTIVQKQTQREGHSFALPILDLLADSIIGWIPEVPGLEMQTGFELREEKFVQVTKEASQFIYEQTYTIDVLMADGRFFSQPCAAFDPITVGDFLPRRTCLVTADGTQTGLAIWRRKTSSDETEEYVVENDPKCPNNIGDILKVTCSEQLDGSATYEFTPKSAITYNKNGSRIVDQSRVVTGNLFKVWKCYKPKPGQDPSPHPPWFKLKVDVGLWRNELGTVPNQDPNTSAVQPLLFETK